MSVAPPPPPQKPPVTQPAPSPKKPKEGLPERRVGGGTR